MFQECITIKFEKVKFNNQNTSDVNLAWSIWKNDINETVLDVIGKFRSLTPLSTIFQLYRGGKFYW
jgi:hypothetical protein